MAFLVTLLVFLSVLLCLNAAPFMNTKNCNASVCKLPDCYCPSTAIPGGLPLSKTPQFIIFTLDDSMYVSDFQRMQNYSWIFDDSSIKDSVGCPVKLSWYALEEWTDFNMIKFVSKIGDINLHTWSHETGATTNLDTWRLEENTLLRDYQALGQVPNGTIKGSRAPFLQTNDAYFTFLQENDIKFDSSMVYLNEETKLNFWPFTLNYGVPDHNMCDDPVFGSSCPTIAFPGLWEFPMISFDYDSQGNLQDPLFDDYDQYLALMKQNFLDTYNSNKVPRGLNWHWRYFSVDNNFGLLTAAGQNPVNQTKKKLFTEFYTWLATFPDVIFATERQVIEWMKNPVENSITKTLPMFKNCGDHTKTPWNSCVGGTTWCMDSSVVGSNIWVCGSECPSIYPQKGALWKFPDGYTNNGYLDYKGTLVTFDGIEIETGAYKGTSNYTGSSYNTTNISYKFGNEDQFSWPGQVIVTFGKSSGDPYALGTEDAWFCSKFAIKNIGKTVAKGFILRFESCPILSRLTDLWGNVDHTAVNDSSSFTMLGSDLRMSANKTYKIGGWCMDVNFVHQREEFKYPDSFRFAVDLYATQPKCTLPNCNLFCGDHVCKADRENASNCPMDCGDKLECPSSRRLLSSLVRKR